MEEKNIGKRIGIAILIIILLLLIFAGIFIAWRIASHPRLYINSIEVEDPDDLESFLQTYSSCHGLFEDDELDRRFVTYEIDPKDKSKVSGIGYLYSRLYTCNIDVRITYTINEQALRDYIDEYNQGKIATEDAKIIVSDGEYVISPEIYGTMISYESVIESSEGMNQIRLEECVASPEVTSASLQEKCDALNTYAKWSCTYDNGSSITAPAECVVWNEETGAAFVDDSFLDSELERVEEEYNTIGESQIFHTSSGTDVELSGGNFGRAIDYDDELTELKSLFASAESATGREPKLKTDKGVLGNTYVEVSKDSQHLWLYIDGQMIGESDVVTGQGSGKRGSTPSGIFYITEKIPGKYLVGEGYRTWVNRWMRLTNYGVGLHDAGWRSSFGGEIYRTDGSHGCINLPSDFAYWLYDNVWVNMPVVIY